MDQINNNTSATQSTSQTAGTQTGFVGLTSRLTSSYGPQAFQILLSTALVMSSSYLQTTLYKVSTDVQLFMSNVQLVYLQQAESLYALSMQYASGIIEVNDKTFLINLDLIKKLNFKATDTMVLNAQSHEAMSVSAEAVNAVLAKFASIFPSGKALDKLCVITAINGAISVKIPQIPYPIMGPGLGSIKQEGDWMMIHQGYTAENYIYLINHKTHETYIFRNYQNNINWFMYKHDSQDLYISMGPNQFVIGNKQFMLTQSPNAKAIATTRTRQVEDVMSLAV